MEQLKSTFESIFALLKDFIDSFVAAIKKLVENMQGVKDPADTTNA